MSETHKCEECGADCDSRWEFCDDCAKDYLDEHSDQISESDLIRSYGCPDY